MRRAEVTFAKSWKYTTACSLRYGQLGEIVPLLAASLLALHLGTGREAPPQDTMSCVYSGGIPTSAEKEQRVRRAHIVCINDLKDHTRSDLRELLRVPGVEG